MYPALAVEIRNITAHYPVSEDRKALLQPLIDYIKQRISQHEAVILNCICTHNSRRSHLTQIWAQVAAHYYNIRGVFSYSGGTDSTALYPVIAETLASQGMSVGTISDGSNPVYLIKYAENQMPVIGFSKKYDHFFNPVSGFAAVMTCTQADEGCPFISGAQQRISLPFEDPKSSDGTSDQKTVYLERSRQIASEILYVFSKI